MATKDQYEVVQFVGRFSKKAVHNLEGRLIKVRGVPCVDIRVFVANSTGEAVATKAGLCMATDKLADLHKLIHDIEATCRQQWGAEADDDEEPPQA